MHLDFDCLSSLFHLKISTSNSLYSFLPLLNMAEVETATDKEVSVQYRELKDYDPENIITRQDTRERPRQKVYRYDDMMAKYRIFNFLKIEWFIFHLVFLIVLFEENHWYESYEDEYYGRYASCGYALSGTYAQLLILIAETTLTFVMLIVFFVYFRRGQYIFYESNDIGSVSLSKEAWDAKKIKTKKMFFKICAYDFAIWILNNILIFIIICIGSDIQNQINDWDASCCNDQDFECSTQNDYSVIIYIYVSYMAVQIILLILLSRGLKKQTTINWVNAKLSCI